MTSATAPRLLLLVSLALAVTTGCDLPMGGGDPGAMGGAEKKEKPEPVTVVELGAAETGAVAEVLTTSASVESEASADIVPSTTGIVVSVHRDEGDAVRKGDLLAVLDNVNLDASAERAAADLRRLQGQYEEMQRLASSGAVSSRELEDLSYQLENARTSMREASRSFGQTRLVAPFDGVVAARDVRVGELAGSGKAAFQVVDPSSLRVVAQLPERDLPRVAVGQAAVLISAYDEDARTSGHVERIAPVVDSASGTFRVTIAVDPSQNALRPGQFVTVDLEVDRRVDVVVVPRKAIVYEDGAPVVYLYDEATEEDLEAAKKKKGGGGGDWGGEGGGWGGGGGDGGDAAGGSWWAGLFGGEPAKTEDEEAKPEGPVWVARRTAVELGLVDADRAQILTGLDVGARVITVGQSHLRDGARVRDAALPPEGATAPEPSVTDKDDPQPDAGDDEDAG